MTNFSCFTNQIKLFRYGSDNGGHARDFASFLCPGTPKGQLFGKYFLNANASIKSSFKSELVECPCADCPPSCATAGLGNSTSRGQGQSSRSRTNLIDNLGNIVSSVSLSMKDLDFNDYHKVYFIGGSKTLDLYNTMFTDEEYNSSPGGTIFVNICYKVS